MQVTERSLGAWCSGLDADARSTLWRIVHDSLAWAVSGEQAPFRFDSYNCSACEPIEGPDAFVPGQQGIILEQTGRRAVFLPEVAPEQGWSRQQTLAALCRKAGLAPQAWKEPEARFQIYFSSVLSGE